MNVNVFAIISDGGKLLSGIASETKISTLKSNGFEQVNYSEDFLNALADDEYAIFIPKNEKDVECLYDSTHISSLPHHIVMMLLDKYRQQ